jgi:hypothetical protein
MYDERRYGSVPTQSCAQKLLSDLKSGKAYLHPISEPGCINRLENIIAGKPVSVEFWQH